MDFDLTEEQRLLKDSVTRLLADRYSFENRKGFQARPEGWSRELWRQYAELGLLGRRFTEADGGFGGGPVETMLMMEAFGRALALEPYLATVVLGGRPDQARRRRGTAGRRYSVDRVGRARAGASPMPSARPATICSTSAPRRARTAGHTCSMARRASCCTAIRRTSWSSRRGPPAADAKRPASACSSSTHMRRAFRGAAIRPRTGCARRR